MALATALELVPAPMAGGRPEPLVPPAAPASTSGGPPLPPPPPAEPPDFPALRMALRVSSTEHARLSACVREKGGCQAVSRVVSAARFLWSLLDALFQCNTQAGLFIRTPPRPSPP